MAEVALELGRVWYPPPAGVGRWPHVSRWGEAEWRHWCYAGPSPMTPTEFSLYWGERYRWGVGVPEVDRKGKPTGQVKWLYLPLPRAVALHAARVQHVLYGGARGGSKSHSLRWEIHARCAGTPGYRAILFRRLHEELKAYHVDRARQEVSPNGPIRGRVIGDDLIEYANGSICAFGHCKDVGSEGKYLGAEYDMVAFDQWEAFHVSQTVDIIGACRSSKEGVLSVVRGTANPGGPEPQWLIDRFLTKSPPEDDRLGYNPDEWLYIPARIYDNPYLMDADGSYRRYEGQLAQYAPVRRRQMLLGDWAAREGQFFEELQSTTHLVDEPVPEGSRWYLGLDWGSLRPGCVVWIAITPSGRAVIRHEFKFRGMPLYAAPRAHGESVDAYRRRARETVAGRIQELNEQYGIVAYALVCDPSLEAHKTSGETGVEGLRRVGLPAIAGDNNRELGWLRCRHWFAQAPDGRPWLVIHPDCRYVWRSLTTVVSDPGNPDDVDSSGDDHGCLTSDTMVATADGEKAIVELRVGERVWTRQGLKPVVAIAQTGTHAAILEVALSNGARLTGTGNHPVWVEGQGFTRLDALRYGDRLSAWPATTTATPAVSGGSITARFLRATTSIIATAIRRTTRSTTSSASRPSSISRCTDANRSGRLSGWRSWPRFGPSRWRGIGLRKDAPGIGLTAWPSFAIGPPSPVAVSSADESLSQWIAAARGRASAATTARRWLDAVAESMTSTASAPPAVSSSAPTATVDTAAVLEPAVAVCAVRPIGHAPVYDITVDEAHEFYANGVLVSNSDALRYVLFTRIGAPGGVDAERTRAKAGSIGALIRKAQGKKGMARGVIR